MRCTRVTLIPITLLATTLVLACGGSGRDGIPSAETTQPATEVAVPPAAPTFEEIANTTFQGVDEGSVSLVDGEWEGEPYAEGGATRPRAGLVRDFYLTGDIDGDGGDEAIVLLWTSTGGSGTFDYVAAMGRRNGAVVNLGTAALGDRIDLRRGEIIDGRIVLEVVQAGPQDAACCPGQKMRRAWRLDTSGLVESDAEDLGRLSIADLAGVEWLLTHFGSNEVAPAEPEVTLVFETDLLAGSSGCNRFTGSASEGEMSGDMTIGPVATTRKMCPPEIQEIEDRFLNLFSGVNKYSFVAGRLALSYQHDDKIDSLLFSARPLGE